MLEQLIESNFNLLVAVEDCYNNRKPFHRVKSIKIPNAPADDEDGNNEKVVVMNLLPVVMMKKNSTVMMIYSIQLLKGNVIKIYEINNTMMMNRMNDHLKLIWEINLTSFVNSNENSNDDGIDIGWCSAAELNGFIYLFAVSNNLDRNGRELVFRLKIEELKCETIYNNISQNFIRIESELIPDSKRNCFYWFAGLAINGSTLKNCVKFNVEKCEWEELTMFSMGFLLHTHSTLFWRDRFVIIFGGFVSSCVLTANIIAFDVELGEWYSIYQVDPFDDLERIPDCCPRFNSGMTLVSNRWASQFDRTIPSNDQ